MNRTAIYIGVLAALVLALAGCDGSHGPDSLFNRPTYTATAVPDCSRCHHVPVGVRRAVLGANGEFGGSASALSHHVTGSADPAPAQCLVCHEMSAHMQGTVLLRHGDTGSVIAVIAGMPSAIEPFCLSCHDGDGARTTFASGGTPTSPFADGAALGTAPYRMSAEIASQWTASYGHQKEGLTCVGNGSAGTGCHGNGHGTGSVGLLARPLTLPTPFQSAPYEAAHAGDYALCFDCHASYPRVAKEALLGVKRDSNYDWDHQWGILPPYAVNFIETQFRDRYDNAGAFYDDSGGVFSAGNYMNLHYYHLRDENWWYYSSGGVQGGWLYRDSIPSTVHCLTCHSVHGSNTQWGWVYDAFLYSRTTASNGDEYGAMGLVNLAGYPINCLYNCHIYMPPTHDWVSPPGDCFNKACGLCSGPGCI